jgi:hypothetical protein
MTWRRFAYQGLPATRDPITLIGRAVASDGDQHRAFWS